MISRRAFLGGLAAAASCAPAAQALTSTYNGYSFSEEDVRAAQDWYTGYIPDGDQEVPFIDLNRLPAHVRRQVVRYDGPEARGTIVVDTANRHLYLVGDGGTAIRYGIGVGREGFAWSGTATIQRKVRWPDWTPPPEMRRRQPGLPLHMAGGVENPLGARAMYLYQNGRDTLYRIHGTNEPWSIGHAVSSGCIRMLNQDALDLFDKVGVGTTVKVRGRVRAPDEEYASGRAPRRQVGWNPIY